MQLDATFHTTIARASRNRIFERIVVDIRDALASQSGFLSLLTPRAHESDREHRVILAAIADGDPQRAADAMNAHLGAVEKAVAEVSSRPGQHG